MPNTVYLEAIREAFSLAPSNVVYLYTLQVSHPLLPGGTLYLVRDRVGHTMVTEDSVSHEFQACGFDFSLPPQSDEGLAELSLAIDDVGKQVSNFLKQVKDTATPVQVVFRPYLASDLSTPQMDPPLVLWLRNARKRGPTVVGTATFADVVNLKYPTALYTRSVFPSLGNVM